MHAVVSGFPRFSLSDINKALHDTTTTLVFGCIRKESIEACMGLIPYFPYFNTYFREAGRQEISVIEINGELETVPMLRG